jgi:hypothetical protein
MSPLLESYEYTTSHSSRLLSTTGHRQKQVVAIPEHEKLAVERINQLTVTSSTRTAVTATSSRSAPRLQLAENSVYIAEVVFLLADIAEPHSSHVYRVSSHPKLRHCLARADLSPLSWQITLRVSQRRGRYLQACVRLVQHRSTSFMSSKRRRI